jgi:hypothetical protein
VTVAPAVNDLLATPEDPDAKLVVRGVTRNRKGVRPWSQETLAVNSSSCECRKRDRQGDSSWRRPRVKLDDGKRDELPSRCYKPRD